jgi:hypothetical protein
MLRRGERWKRVKEVGVSRKPIQQGGRAWYGTMQLFTRRRRWERGGRPTLLNPLKRVFAELRRWVEGKIHGSIEAKLAAGESFFERLSGG